jgi:hypothetical protein
MRAYGGAHEHRGKRMREGGPLQPQWPKWCGECGESTKGATGPTMTGKRFCSECGAEIEKETRNG